ncbi:MULTISPECIES: hypothetical protein [Pseudomonas]|uniref:hypothetical protein n=1 Tax=Pseudomonas TaxID=286 RepID=UPI0020C599BA|nr:MULTISPECIES: hypothetical protein [Pseudomonas]MDH1574212.1 hypothetical protein [Pseudomonas sp. GD03746]UTL83557.1 hypothetical protein NL778_12350 [Pseudomonas putida]
MAKLQHPVMMCIGVLATRIPDHMGASLLCPEGARSAKAGARSATAAKPGCILEPWAVWYGALRNPTAKEVAMALFCRLSLLTLLAGMLLGDIVIATVGLVGVCAAAVYLDIRQDAHNDAPNEPDFLA